MQQEYIDVCCETNFLIYTIELHFYIKSTNIIVNGPSQVEERNKRRTGALRLEFFSKKKKIN